MPLYMQLYSVLLVYAARRRWSTRVLCSFHPTLATAPTCSLFSPLKRRSLSFPVGFHAKCFCVVELLYYRYLCRIMTTSGANFGSTETYHVVNIRMYLNTMESCRLHVEYNFMRVTVFLLLRAINSNEKWKKEKPVTIKSNEIKFLFYQLLPCYIQHLKARARSLIQRSKRL